MEMTEEMMVKAQVYVHVHVALAHLMAELVHLMVDMVHLQLIMQLLRQAIINLHLTQAVPPQLIAHPHLQVTVQHQLQPVVQVLHPHQIAHPHLRATV